MLWDRLSIPKESFKDKSFLSFQNSITNTLVALEGAELWVRGGLDDVEYPKEAYISDALAAFADTKGLKWRHWITEENVTFESTDDFIRVL